MNTVLDILVFLKKRNFTILREFEYRGTMIKEYVYNMKKYLTDAWPPKRGTGPTIKKVIRDEDGKDITKDALRFSGPMKNYLNPLCAHTSEKKFTVRFVNFGLQLVYEDVWKPYDGSLTITDSFGSVKKMELCTTSTNGNSSVSP